jgi:hypothetical protein
MKSPRNAEKRFSHRPQCSVTGTIFWKRQISRDGPSLEGFFQLLCTHRYSLRKQIFFDKLKQLSIPCLIIKVERLINEYQMIIRELLSYEIPLIRKRRCEYETINDEVLSIILGNRGKAVSPQIQSQTYQLRNDFGNVEQSRKFLIV